MTIKKQLLALALSLLGVISMAPALVSAAPQGVASTTTMSAARMDKVKKNGIAEIDRRVAALGNLLTRVGEMKKVSETFKSNLTTNIQNQITLLAALKAKIQADTDGATLKADVESITTAYRVYMLVLPQGRIAAAADREATVINALTELGLKVQARLQDAQKAGADVTALGATLADFGKLLADAQTKAQSAISNSAVLVPDNGDKTKMDANTATLKQARADVTTAQTDLVKAKNDLKTIIDGLKKLKVAKTATTTPAQ